MAIFDDLYCSCVHCTGVTVLCLNNDFVASFLAVDIFPAWLPRDYGPEIGAKKQRHGSAIIICDSAQIAP